MLSFYNEYLMNRSEIFMTEQSLKSSCQKLSKRKVAFCYVHTYPDIFENAYFFLRFGLPSARSRRFCSPQRIFLKTLSKVNFFWKLRCSPVVWTRRTHLFGNTSQPRDIWGSYTEEEACSLFTHTHRRYPSFSQYQCVSVWTQICFENAPCVGADFFLNW